MKKLKDILIELFNKNRIEYTQPYGEVVNMLKRKETTGNWHFDEENKRLCIEAKTTRSWCLSDQNKELSDFDSTKFKKGEIGKFTIESNDDGSATLKIK